MLNQCVTCNNVFQLLILTETSYTFLIHGYCSLIEFCQRIDLPIVFCTHMDIKECNILKVSKYIITFMELRHLFY